MVLNGHIQEKHYFFGSKFRDFRGIACSLLVSPVLEEGRIRFRELRMPHHQVLSFARCMRFLRDQSGHLGCDSVLETVEGPAVIWVLFCGG